MNAPEPTRHRPFFLKPPSPLGHKAPMAQLLIVREGPGMQPVEQLRRRMSPRDDFQAQIRCQRGIIKQVVLDAPTRFKLLLLLGTYSNSHSQQTANHYYSNIHTTKRSLCLFVLGHQKMDLFYYLTIWRQRYNKIGLGNDQIITEADTFLISAYDILS